MDNHALQAAAEKRRQKKLNSDSKKKGVPEKEAETKAPPKLTPAMRKIAKAKTEGKKPSMMEHVLKNKEMHDEMHPVGSLPLMQAPREGGSVTINVNA